MWWIILGIVTGLVLSLIWSVACYLYGFYDGEKECWRKIDERERPPRFP